MYELYEWLGNDNTLLLNAINNNSMGGPLTRALKCGNDTEIKTQYSEKSYNTTDLQYVEMITNYDQDTSDYSKLYFFVSTADFQKIEKIIVTNDNKMHQCRSDTRACLDTEDSFTKHIDMFYAEVHYNVRHNMTQIHEGYMSKGKNEGIKRHMDWKSSALEWYKDDKLNGKQFLKWIKRE